MRLINVQTMQLEEFMVDPPPYAILSHTWGAEEVTFADFNHADPLVRERKAGWRKIENTCRLSREDQYSYQYAWIDTCCIDKSSSAELSEAINSMYAWYAGSQVCYAYLEDVPPQTPNLDSSDDWFSSRPQLWAWETYDFGVKSAFAGSRWFRRGWTLQELVAPGRVHFYDQKWGPIASRRQIPPDLSLITGIPQAVLQGGANILHYPVGARISWAADRQTTRPEDLAYSLLGLLDINMPLLYGEGSRAFLRLQEEILRQHEDDTLFLWCSPPADPWALRGMLANSPSDFANFREEAYYSFRGIKPSFTLDMGKIEPVSAFSSPQSSSGVDNRGVSFTGYIVDIRPEYSTGGTAMLHLNCRLNSADWVCLYLEQLGPNRYARARPSEVFIVDENEYDHSDGGEKTIIVYKTDDVIRNLVSNNRLAFLDKFYGPENKSLLYQYGFSFLCSGRVAGRRKWAGLTALKMCRDLGHLADTGGLETTFNRRHTMISWEPFVAVGPSTTLVNMKFWNGEEELYFVVYFNRVPTPSSGSQGADPGTATLPSPLSWIGLHSTSVWKTDPRLCLKTGPGLDQGEMTVAQAEGIGEEAPRTLVATNNSGSRPLSISVKLEEWRHLKLWVVKLVED